MKQAEISGSIAMETSDSLTDLYVQVIVEGPRVSGSAPYARCMGSRSSSDSIVVLASSLP